MKKHHRSLAKKSAKLFLAKECSIQQLPMFNAKEIHVNPAN